MPLDAIVETLGKSWSMDLAAVVVVLYDTTAVVLSNMRKTFAVFAGNDQSVAASLRIRPAVMCNALLVVPPLAVRLKAVFVFVVPVFVTLIAKPWTTTLALVFAPLLKMPARRCVAPVNPVVVEVRVRREPDDAAVATADVPDNVRLANWPEVNVEVVQVKPVCVVD